MKHIGQHAIVIGASIGGLLAARALSDFYAVVTVLERDSFPQSDIPRKGVPQGRHAHGLLARGRDVIETFFPGWTDEVVASGGARGDIAGDVNWVGHGVTLKSAPSDLVGLLAPRPVLEGRVRRRLMALPNVRVIENCAVQELIADDSRATIKGVRSRIGSGDEHRITADLVVDASGRGSSSPAWLEGLGYAPPVEEKIEIGIGYTTRTYRRRPSDLNINTGAVVEPQSLPDGTPFVSCVPSESKLVSAGSRCSAARWPGVVPLDTVGVVTVPVCACMRVLNAALTLPPGSGLVAVNLRPGISSRSSASIARWRAVVILPPNTESRGGPGAGSSSR